MQYHKIQSLFKRELKGDRKIIWGDYSLEEFQLINKWWVEEKLDGMNIRVVYSGTESFKTVEFRGRTDDAQLPPDMLKYLQETFTIQKFQEQFPESNFVVLFGEGCGPKIQNPYGNLFSDEPTFVLFDVFCSGMWLNRDSVFCVAVAMDLNRTEFLGEWTEKEIVDFVRSRPKSKKSKYENPMEGVVCRTEPLLKQRNNEPLMWKLKVKDL
jgi:ATP-dependent RNA circularization protein (DNA/RNA ligase family)